MLSFEYEKQAGEKAIQNSLPKPEYFSTKIKDVQSNISVTIEFVWPNNLEILLVCIKE